MPIITIFGATGTQGSSVLEAILADGKYTPRAVSRSLDSDRSKALLARGIEVVVGNLWDKESLKTAMRGSEAVFSITNFWDPEIFPAGPEGKGELTQGKNLVNAAKEVGVKFFIWSSVSNATKESNGLYKHIYHFDNKAAITEYLKESGVPYAVLLTGWFAENLWTIGSLRKSEKGSGYTLPIAKYGPEDLQSFTWIDQDLGKAAVTLLTNYGDPSKGVLGKSYPVITMRCTFPEFAAAIAAGIKKEVTFITLETTGIREFDEMYLFQAKFGLYSDTPAHNPDLVALGVKFSTMEEFIQKEVVPRFA
ncbi:NAD(P)-binding protein [Mycena galopus ATCC 62051]|nr:NAD(P)-binding protein [Mycena galopus ATCC 62051]